MAPAAVSRSSPPAAPADEIRANEMAVALRNGLKMGASLVVTWSVVLIVKFRVPAHLGVIRQGRFGFAESFATMFFACLNLGIDTFIIKEAAVRPKCASDVVGGVFLLRVLMSVVLFAGMGLVLAVTGRPAEVVYAVGVFGLTNFLMMLNGTLGAVLQAISRVGAPVVANVAAKLIWGVGLLIGLHYDAPLAILALPALLGELLRIAILHFETTRVADLKYRIDVPAVRHAVLDSIPYFINGLALGILGTEALTLLGFIRHDEREVGWFAATQNVAYLCMLLSPMLFWVAMPLLARANARSKEEGMFVFRRCLEALVVSILPVTVLLSAGSGILVRLAFKAQFAPAALGLSILSLVFVLTYMNMIMSQALIIMGKGWSVTTISISAVFLTAGLMILLVPLGRHLVGTGGECAGAAAAVIGSEATSLILMTTRFDTFPLDARNVRVLGKSLGIAICTLIVDRLLRSLGPARLAIDAALYVTAAFAIGAGRTDDIVQVIGLLKLRGARAQIPVAQSSP